jgi:hypothetical protein
MSRKLIGQYIANEVNCDAVKIITSLFCINISSRQAVKRESFFLIYLCRARMHFKALI